MSKMVLPETVVKVMDESSKIVGRWTEDDFNIGLFNECLDMGMESPIEQVLYCALETIRRINRIEDGDVHILYNKEGVREEIIRGLRIHCQTKIDKYRVDFLIWYEDHNRQKKVVVECDSQQFHERTEKERRYEKARDRYLHRQGYTVFHFTGKEILEDPYKIASEIIAFLTGDEANDLYCILENYE